MKEQNNFIIKIVVIGIIIFLIIGITIYLTYNNNKEYFDECNITNLFVENYIEDSVENYNWTIYENFNIDLIEGFDENTLNEFNENKKHIQKSIISLKYFANTLEYFYGNTDIPKNILNFQTLAEQLQIPKNMIQRLLQNDAYIKKWLKIFKKLYEKYEKGQINGELFIKKVAPEYNKILNNEKSKKPEYFSEKYENTLKIYVQKCNNHINKFKEKIFPYLEKNEIPKIKKELWNIAKKFIGEKRKYLFHKLINNLDDLNKFYNNQLKLEDYEPEIFIENYELWEKIKSGVKSGYEYVKDKVKKAGKYIIEKGSELGNTIMEGIKNAGLWIKEVSKTAYEAAKKLGSSTLELIEEHAIPVLKNLINEYIIIKDGKREDGTAIKEVHIKLAPVRSLLKHAIVAFAISLPLPLTGPVVMKLLDLGFDYILLKLQKYISKFINYIIENKFPDFKYAVYLENYIYEKFLIEKYEIEVIKEKLRRDIKDIQNKSKTVENNLSDNLSDTKKIIKYNLGKEKYKEFINIIGENINKKDIILLLDKIIQNKIYKDIFNNL